MDVLLIVTNCQRKPYFLTRSDVFRHPTLKKFFTYLRMLPIYRLRDGRESLKKNSMVFDRCALLFQKNHAIVLFPEANHNLKRRVRPLSKGFTRILFKALEKSPQQDIHVVPVGMNYVKNAGFPDQVALYYDKSIKINDLYDPNDLRSSVNKVKKAVSDRLKVLTTHIEDEENYGAIVQRLDALPVDYLNPCETNEAIKNWGSWDAKVADFPRRGALQGLLKGLFTFFNFPLLAVWRIGVRPRVWEPEFTATLRFGWALLTYPLYYLVLFAVIAAVWNSLLGLAIIVGLFLFNWGYVKFSGLFKYPQS